MNDNIRLGYACINTDLAKSKITINRGCIKKTLHEKGIEYAIELAKNNLRDLYKILQWNAKKHISVYRMSSDMFPHITDPEFITCGSRFAYSLEIFTKYFKTIGRYVRKTNQRLSFHPSQFNQIGTPNEAVFEKTVRDLEFQATVLDLMELDYNSVLVVHGGGTYKDKQKTIERWCDQFLTLPACVQKRIALENCERQYNILDTILISDTVFEKTEGLIRIPLIFDTHHHECFKKINNIKIPIKSFLKKVLKSWDGRIPKFHISEQDPSKRVGAHSEYVEVIPAYFFKISKFMKIDIMIEAKAKEQAVFKLYEKYKNLEE